MEDICKGKSYEIWLFVLILFKGYGKQFDIGKEVKLGHKFDDVAIRYENTKTGKTDYIFCQVKLVNAGENKFIDSDVLLGEKKISMHKDDFKLTKYFTSYLRITDEFIETNNELVKLVIYTNVGLQKEIRKIVKGNSDDYSCLFTAKNSTEQIYLDTNSDCVRKIINTLKNTESDLNSLVDLLFKYIDKKCTDPINSKPGDLLDYYHYALINEEVLELKSTKKTKKCCFHPKFIKKEFAAESRAEQLYKKLFAKTNKDEDDFKNRLKQSEWKVWKGFGKKARRKCEKLPSYSIEETDVLHFLEILEFKVDEPNLEHLPQHAKEEIEVKKIFEIGDADYLNDRTEKYIREFKKTNPQDEDWILNLKKDGFFTGFKKHFSTILAKNISDHHLNHFQSLIHKLNLQFQKPINGLQQFVDDPKSRGCVIKSSETFLTALKVAIYKNEMKPHQIFYFEKDDLTNISKSVEIFTLLEDEVQSDKIVILNWENGNYDEQFRTTVKKLQKLPKLIIIGSKIEKNEEINKIFENMSQLQDEDISIEHLKNHEKILDLEIDFMGEKVPLKNIVHQDKEFKLNEIITPAILSKLIKGETQFLEKSSIEENGSCDVTYISRLFSPPIFSDDILKKKDEKISEIFAISGDDAKKLVNGTSSKNHDEAKIEFSNITSIPDISNIASLSVLKNKKSDKKEDTKFNGFDINSEETIKNYEANFVILDNHNVEEQLLKLQKENSPSTNIHWLEYKSNYFIWRKTYGSISSLVNKRIDSNVQASLGLTEENVITSNNNIEIVTGIAGSGKSSFLNNVPKLYCDPRSLVIRINLIEHKRLLDELNKDKVNLNPPQLLCKFFTSDTPLQIQIKKYCFNALNNINVLLLLDGYDEIQSDTSREFFINHIMNLKICGKIMITSRTSLVHELEEKFNSLAITLLKFTNENQKVFLKEIFKGLLKEKNVDDDKLEIYVTKVVDMVSESVNDKERSLTGIPLQLKMVGEIYQEAFEQYVVNENGENETYLPEKIDLIELYEKFVKKNYESDFLKKYKSIDFLKENPDYYQKYLVDQQNLAMKSILSETDIEVFPEVAQMTNKEIKFTHQTFGEYFCATFLFENCLVKKCNSKQQEYFLREILSKDYYQNIRIFLNILLKNFHVSHEKIKCFAEELLKLQESTVNINIRPIWEIPLQIEKKVSRLFVTFYLNVIENNNFIFLFIIDCLHEHKDRLQNIFQVKWKSDIFLILHGAVYNCNITVTKKLLEYQTDTNIRNPNNGETALHIASFRGNDEMVNLLLQYNANVNIQDYTGNTPLLAAVLGYQNVNINKILNMLFTRKINKIEDIRIYKYGTSNSASQKKNFECVKILLKKKSTMVNTQNIVKLTPLHLAALIGHIETVELLIQMKADINAENTNKQTPLHYAASNGHVETVKLLIQKKANINAEDTNKATPLHLAAFNGHVETVKLLIQNKANINAEDTNKATPLHAAALNGHVETVELLIQKKADINAENTNKQTPLHAAALNGHVETVKLLIQKKADINAKDINKQTPLHLAASNGHVETVKLLIQKKANINAENTNKQTPLHAAALNGHVETVELLIQNKANINAKDIDKRTPLHLAALNGHVETVELLIQKKGDINAENTNKQTPLHAAALNGHVETVELLIQNKANINAKDIDKRTPLHYAALNGHVETVKLLIQEKADINAKDIDKQTPSHLAAFNGHVETVKLLIQKKAYINAENTNKQTPLHFAAFNGHVETVKLLIQEEADINAENTNKQTPLHAAALNGHVETVELLIQKKANINAENTNKATPLHLAALNGHVETVELLIQKKAYINAENTNKQTPLHFAAFNGHVETVKLLIQEEADINAENTNKQTPLHLAALNGHVETVELLIQNKANINAEDTNKATPLHLAALNGHVETVELLIQKKADINAENTNKQTPLHYAASNGHVETVKLLIQKKANINAEDTNKATPLHLAAFNGHVETVKLLIQMKANINAEDTNQATPLHYAASNGHVETVKLLIQKKANINAENTNKATPLHLAASNGHVETVKLLIQKKANINAENTNKATPLHLAASNGHVETVKLLIQMKANINAEDTNKSTPL